MSKHAHDERPTEMPVKTESRIPHFQSIEEETEFWDTHSTTEFEDEFTPVTDVGFVIRRAPATKALTVRVDEQTFRRLAEQANRQGIGPSTLVRMWIGEHLRRHEDQPVPR